MLPQQSLGVLKVSDEESYAGQSLCLGEICRESTPQCVKVRD